MVNKHTIAVILLACAPLLGGALDFIIVSPPDLREAWETYAELRRAARPDMSIAVAGTDAIYAAHPFGPGLECRNAAESVHAFIRENAYDGVMHFLLGGMWLDARDGHTNDLYFATGEKLSLSNCVPGICVFPYTGDKGVEIPSDMFYACLDDPANGIVHPWDPDGDGVYLSAEDYPSCDLSADVCIGRFAAVPYAYGGTNAPTPGELVLAYADKVARGTGSSFTGVHRVGAASCDMVRTYAPGSRDFGRQTSGMEFYDQVPDLWSDGHPNPVADTEYAVREVLRTLVVPNWPVLEVTSLHGTGPAFASRHADWDSAVADFFADDMAFTTCRSHGTAYAASGAGITRSLYAQAAGLTLFGDFCVPCMTGAIDSTQRIGGRTTVVPCLGVAATCAPGGGFLAGVHNSRYGWSSELSSINVSDGFSGTLSQLLTRRIFACGDASFGLAHLNARQEFVENYTLTGTRVYALCEQMFYGDPTLGLPAVEKVRSWTEDLCVTVDVAVVTATFADGAVIAGNGTFKVMDAITCGGTNLALSVAGGAGRGVVFTGVDSGFITVSGAPFYLGGLTNCASAHVLGGNKVLDVSRSDGALASLAVDGDGAETSTNVLRCMSSGLLASLNTIAIRSATLALETADAFGAGDVPLVAVTNGALRLSPNPLSAWPDGEEHLARPVNIASSSIAVDAGAKVFFGLHDDSGFHPFNIEVDGACAIGPSQKEEASVGLVGTTAITLAEGASIDLSVGMYDADSGEIIFSGSGTARASVNSLAGNVEVREGAVLELAETPLPSVTALVVRAGATLRIPAEKSGLHAMLTGAGALTVEDGAFVEDLDGNALVGRAANGMFFEPGAALCWRGGAGNWSEAESWYDVVTGTTGPWMDGRIAVFASAASVSNDCAGVEVEGFVFNADVDVSGGEIHLASGFVTVPSNYVVSVAASVVTEDDVTKAGEGTLALRGEQGMDGSLSVQGGVLELDGVMAPAVTNLAAIAGSALALRGASSLPNASSRLAISAGALRLASDFPASLDLGVFVPANRFVLPRGVTLRAAGDYGMWKMTVDGTLECSTVPAMSINSWIDGTGTVRVAGLWTDTTGYARFSFCRVEMVADELGMFQVVGSPGTGIMRRLPKNFLFDGVTIAPCGADVHVTNASLPEGLVTMCVNTNGVVFDTSDVRGRTIYFDDPVSTNLFFYGPGDVTKIGDGSVRFESIDDLHEGRTFVRGGRYAVSTWSLSSGFSVTGEGATAELAVPHYEGDVFVGAGSVLDLSSSTVTTVTTTNLQMAAGATLKVCVTSEGCDLIDVRGGMCSFPSDGAVELDVEVRPEVPPGLYSVLTTDGLPETASWIARFFTPGGQHVNLESTPDRSTLCIRVRRAPTVLYFR